MPAISLSLKTKGHREAEQRGLAKFPSLLHWAHIFALSYLSTTIHSSSNLSQKHSGLTISSGLHFLMKAPMSSKTYIK